MGNLDKLSVFISLILRHQPDAVGIQFSWMNMDGNGIEDGVEYQKWYCGHYHTVNGRKMHVVEF